MGWDKYRETVHDNQLKAGVIPAGSKLTERPEQIPSWDSQPEEHRKLFALQAENYADFLEHTDYEVGRVVDAIEKLGELDNTLVIYIMGDNGSSAEGSLVGTPNEIMSLNGMQPSIEQAMGFMDKLGPAGNIAALCGRLGLGGRYAVPVDEAGRVAFRRHAQRDDRVMAEGHQGSRQGSHASSTTASTSCRR